MQHTEREREREREKRGLYFFPAWLATPSIAALMASCSSVSVSVCVCAIVCVCVCVCQYGSVYTQNMSMYIRRFEATAP